jgi:hypothetical protein
MTPEERIQLARFLQLLGEARPGQKDETAEAMIRDAFARQPDAAYLLVQRVLQLELAQEASRQELERTSGLPPSFFSQNAFGRRPAGATAAGPLRSATVQAQAPQSAWGSGLLGTVASTAVGVVAGSMLAQGIGSLFGNRSGTPEAGSTDIPPGGGTLVETDYGGHGPRSDAGDLTSDFGGGGDFGDAG